MTGIEFASALETLEALHAGRVSSEEVLDAYLSQIDECSWVNAVVTIDEGAREAARRSDELRHRGEGPIGPLHGLPITVKHDSKVRGMLSTYGSTSLRDFVPDEDAELVARLREAGAIIFGRTNLPEWATDGQAYNKLHGTTANPWDPERTTGGSSGGSAAAVASGMTGLDLGSDMGGSIRIPASWCGVFGLKPTWGVFPPGGAIPGPGDDPEDIDLINYDVSSAGPLARSAGDLDLALTVLTTPRDQRGGMRPWLPPAKVSDLRDLRVLAWFDASGYQVDPATLEILHRTCTEMERAGARVTTEVSPPGSLGELEEMFEVMFMADLGGGATEAGYAELVAGMDMLRAQSSMSDMHWRALGLSHRQWLLLQRRRLRLRKEWADLFGDFDIVVTPTVPTAALPHDHSEPVWDRTFPLREKQVPWRPTLTSWCGAVGVLGLPAVTAPVGLDAAGLPVGMQVVADAFDDRTAIAAAGLITSLMGGPLISPLTSKPVDA